VRTCEVIEHGVKCELQYAAKGMCMKHYARFQRTGNPLMYKNETEVREHEKWCPGCKAWLANSNFSSNKRRRSGLADYCRPCRANDRLARRYGMTREIFDEMLVDQGGSCAICDAVEPGGQGTWHVDHDHNCCPAKQSCGSCVRGLLCSRCNLMLGHADDDIDRMLSAVTYLMTHSRIPTTTGGK
jgi:hypothetical protein